MKKAKIIVALVLLTFSLSGCANAERFEVSAPSSQETVTTEPAQSTVPQESTAVSVSESTEIPAENTAKPETEKAQPEVSIPADRQQPHGNYPAESIRTRATGRTCGNTAAGA